jgi:hypothetical protein
MTGAIAGVTCANGKIHHFVCVKKDGSLGHIIANFNKEDHKLAWSKGDLSGQAHLRSHIAIGCPDTTATTPRLDVVYQDPSGVIVATSRDPNTDQWSTGEFGFWSMILCESADLLASRQSTVTFEGTSLAINYHNGAAPYQWCVRCAHI